MNRIVLGALAGAAGTFALDVTTYADVALRGRPSSNMPSEVVRRIAQRARIDALGRPDEESNDQTKNRRSGLGALSGYAVGLTVGALYGVAHPLFSGAPLGLKAAALGGGAMAASDVPATMLGATDPRTWGASGWLADVIPHVMYGVVAAMVFESLNGLQTRGDRPNR